MTFKGRRHSPEARARMAHGARRAHERKRRLRELERDVAELAPRDLRYWLERDLVTDAMKPHVAASMEEAARVAKALRPPGRELTPQRQVLVDDLARLGAAMRGLLGLYLRSMDPELASRMATLVNARRASLQALGLDDVTEEPELRDVYPIERVERPQERETPASDANVAEPEGQVADAGDRSTAAQPRSEEESA